MALYKAQLERLAMAWADYLHRFSSLHLTLCMTLYLWLLPMVTIQ